MKAYKNIPLILLLLVMAALAFANLGNRYMYLDEVNTALMGENVLTYGYPRAWDGNYLITSANGNDFDKSFTFISYPWVQYYIAAFAQVFGNSNFCLRFWYVVLGIISVIPFYYLSLGYTKKRHTALIAALFYSLSVPVILYIRTVRYYSPSLLLIILAYFLYHKYIENPSYKYSILFSLACILLFHTFHVFFFITMAVILLCFFIFDYNKQNLKKFIISVITITLFTLPFFIYYYSFIMSLGTTREGFQGLDYFLAQLPGYFWLLHVNFFPVIALAGIYAFVSTTKNLCSKKKQIENDSKNLKMRVRWLLAGPIIINILVVSLFSGYYADRFLIACVPACFILSAYLACKIMGCDKILGFTVVFLLVFTNILNISPYMGLKLLNIDAGKVDAIIKPPVPYFYSKGSYSRTFSLGDYLNKFCYIRSYLSEYYQSTKCDYDNEVEGAVRFLNTYAKKGDTVVTEEWLADAIYYYTGLKVTNRLRLPDADEYYKYYKTYPNALQYDNLTKFDDTMADWVVLTGFEIQRLYGGNSWGNIDNFERVLINGYPVVSYIGVSSEYDFFTSINGRTLTIYRNKLTTLPINDENIEKEDLEGAIKKGVD